ncbi:MAG TPA: ABC transporter ATP-binding protein [Miltoncostaeaceae bacterium]|nr:ABC transporter ATP-binding protein [Miltoncostaeaceae bacterium]
MTSSTGPGATVAAGVLELREVTKRYARAGRPAVDGLTLTVPAGKVCVLIGPSGCGKTTAMKMVNRLIEPTAGEILIDGTDVRRLPAAQLRRRIGYVIQQVGLLPHLTVAANVATVPRLLGWDRDRTGARVEELLALVGLPAEEYARRYPAELSGGQQQRVGLARALAADPPLMLMDEPFSAVDPITRERLQNDFLRLHRQVPKTVVFVSHDIDEAVKMADLVAVMRDGRLVQFAPPAELLAHPVDDFVADFVGADRALKGLGLTRLEEIPLLPAPAITSGTAADAVHARVAAGDLAPLEGALLVVDGDGRPLRWLHRDRLSGTVPAGPPTVEPVLDQVSTLRDALSALFEANAAYGVVVDGAGRCTGLVGVHEITGVLRGPGAEDRVLAESRDG